ncbi:hypothetical protein FB451DRAFT_1103931, partial [Mycena latifolia]
MSSSDVQNAVVNVTVGGDPSGPGGPFTFDPTIVTASTGTTVKFIFSGSPGNHSVTQSSFDAPCTPLPGGLDSGFQLVLESETGGPFSTWSFTVSDDLEPLWFFCRQRVPASHCNAGMVLVINPPDSGTERFGEFAAFRSAAEVAVPTVL